MKRCYYEVLQVDRKATSDQIKKSFRKMALKCHPDKNPSQDAKQRFVQINEAYNVLSDPNERTWYDNNREKILFNKDDMSKEDIEQYTFGFNIWGYFTTACFRGYEDQDQKGFYAVYRDVFERIKSQQSKAFTLRDDLEEDQRKFEGFGDSTTNQAKLLKFYEDWENFTSYKTFAWSQEWDTREANSRWMRREMEKENKKQRQSEKKTYIKTIRDLVAYVRKRDPRFIEYMRIQKQEEAKKQLLRVQREKEKKIQKEKMRQVKQQLQQERFREIEEYYRKQNEQSGNKQAMTQQYEEEQEHQYQYYCELCAKDFKSENQLRNHQKSKQHKQMVKQIQKEVMMKEDKQQQAFKEEEQAQPEPIPVQESESPKKKNKKKKKKNNMFKNDLEEEPQEEKKAEPEPPKREPTPPKKQEKRRDYEDSESDDDADAFMSLLGNRGQKAAKEAAEEVKPEKKKGGKVKQPQPDVEKQQSQSQESQKKVGKAKQRKQKKAQQQKSKQNSLKCNICGQAFPSKTKLFDHIKKTGHASAK